MPGVFKRQYEDPSLFHLGDAEMDASHEGFIELLNDLNRTSDSSEFKTLFRELHRHTEMHFSGEFQSMKQKAFPALIEHHADHQRILGQLVQFRMRVEQGRTKLARAFIREQLPYWFHSHVITMDSALAAHLKTTD